MRLRFPPRAVEGQLRVVANGLFLGKPKTRANLGMPTGIFRRPSSLSAARTHRGRYRENRLATSRYPVSTSAGRLNNRNFKVAITPCSPKTSAGRLTNPHRSSKVGFSTKTLSNHEFTAGRLINATHRSNRTRSVPRRLTSRRPVFIATLLINGIKA